MKLPLCIPLVINLAVTLSPSATISSTLTLWCSKAARHVVMISFMPCMPGAEGRAYASKKLGDRSSFAANKSPFEGPSSKNLRMIALFSFIDIYFSIRCIEALMCFDWAIEEDPINSETWYNKGER
jgi:hypothetical protein